MRLEDLAPIAITFVMVGIALSIGAAITTTTGNSLTVNSTAWFAVQNASAGLGQLASWLPTIGLILAASVIIGILFSSFYRPEGA